MKDKVLYRVCWKSTSDGKTGNGVAMFTKEDAESTARYLDKIHQGKFTHWVEPVEEESND